MTALLSATELADAYPWPDSERWVRAMMVMTLDGASVGPDGRSRSISSDQDRAILSEVRRLSDVVLIGASTFRSERYKPMLARPSAAEERALLGLASAPVVAIVSGSLDLPWEEPIFSESAVRPIVITSAGSPRAEDALARAEAHADVIVLPGASMDAEALIDALVARGLGRIVCEGGPVLLAQLIRAGLVDEADIAIAPILAGGGQIAGGEVGQVPRRMRLAGSFAIDDFLFTRYLAS